MSQNHRAFTEHELRLLRFLWEQGPATFSQLVAAVPPLPPAAVQQQVNSLVKEGFVVCHPDGKEAIFAIAEEEPLPAAPASQPQHSKTQPRVLPSFLSGVLNQLAPAANAVVTAAGAAVASAAVTVARKAVADATAHAVANATAAGGKAVGSFLKAAGKAALGKVTGAKKAEQVVDQIVDTAADIGKQVSHSVAEVVGKIVSEAMKQNPNPADADRPPRKDG